MINFIKSIILALLNSVRNFKVFGKAKGVFKIGYKSVKGITGVTGGILTIGKFTIKVPLKCVAIAKFFISTAKSYGPKLLTISGIGMMAKSLYDFIFASRDVSSNDLEIEDEEILSEEELIKRILSDYNVDDPELKKVLSNVTSFRDVKLDGEESGYSDIEVELFDLDGSGEISYKEYLIREDIRKILCGMNDDLLRLLFYINEYKLDTGQVLEYFGYSKNFKRRINRM